MKKFAFILILVFTSYGCLQTTQQPTASQHQDSLHSQNERKMTLGVVQSTVKEGDSQADVATSLGSPNIVTHDSEGNETWIYDKISTETSYSDSSRGSNKGVGVGGGAVGMLGSVLMGGAGGVNSSVSESNRTGASSQSQKTLTVVIKFDSEKKVKTVRYQSSSF